MARVVAFLGMEVNEDYLTDMAEFASVENLRKKEQENYFWRSGSRVQAKDVNDPNTYKVRKAKVGGYRDYFDDDQVAELGRHGRFPAVAGVLAIRSASRKLWPETAGESNPEHGSSVYSFIPTSGSGWARWWRSIPIKPQLA